MPMMLHAHASNSPKRLRRGIVLFVSSFVDDIVRSFVDTGMMSSGMGLSGARGGTMIGGRVVVHDAGGGVASIAVCIYIDIRNVHLIFFLCKREYKDIY